MQPVNDIYPTREDDADPQRFRAEETRCCYLIRQLNDRITEPFYFNPLSPQHHVDAKRRKQQDDDKPAPRKHRFPPHLGADVGRAGLARKIDSQTVLVCQCKPLWEIAVEKRAPLILLRRQPTDRGDIRNNHLKQVMSADSRRYG